MKKILCALAMLAILGGFAVCFGFAEEAVTEEVVGKPSYYVERGIALIKKRRDHGASPIRAFAVSDDGKVAICFGESGKRTVLVLDEKNDVDYGYNVTISGDIIPKWTEKGLTLYLASSRIAVVLGENGEFIEKTRYLEAEEGNEAVKSLFYDSAEEYTLPDGTVYRLIGETKAPDGGAVYDSLIQIDSDGTERTVYEANIKPKWGQAVALVGVGVAVLGSIGIVAAEVCMLKNPCPSKDDDNG